MQYTAEYIRGIEYGRKELAKDGDYKTLEILSDNESVTDFDRGIWYAIAEYKIKNNITDEEWQ